MGYFHAMDGRAARRRGQPPLSGDEQHLAVDRHADILRLNAGKRGDDPQLPFELEDVERRLPVRHLGGRAAGPKELAMEPVRPYRS